MIILLHFHLKNAIMFGKKRHIDVQVTILSPVFSTFYKSRNLWNINEQFGELNAKNSTTILAFWGEPCLELAETAFKNSTQVERWQY